jgi:hypothetical protein
MELLMSLFKIILGILTAFAIVTVPVFAGIYWSKRERQTKPEEKGKSFSELWWEYFKPLGATPVAWLVLHLIVFLAFPDVFKEIWNFYFNLLMSLEISVIVLNSILNKKVKFEEKTSR